MSLFSWKLMPLNKNCSGFMRHQKKDLALKSPEKHFPGRHNLGGEGLSRSLTLLSEGNLSVMSTPLHAS